MTDPLPIDALLTDLLQALRREGVALLSAPPGAGKSTGVPLALLRSGLFDGQRLLLLQPRRLAARAVAARMAQLCGETVGQTVGYQVRFEERASAATRILVVTEGILTRRLLSDPLLEGVGCVILDEFHQRSIDADLCLAFLREVREVREDLRLLVMSATLQAAPLRRYLGECPHLQGELRQYPLQIEYLPEPDRRPLPAQVRSAVGRLLAGNPPPGDLLVFLPGAGEIRAAMAALREPPLPGAPELVPLYGALAAEEQDRALQPGSRRRVILATNIAETSLTVPGVTAVIDSGLVKRLRYQPRLGLNRLELGHLSRASAEQRAGRAGREAPGRVLRLWTAAEQTGLPEAEVPEIQRVDPAPLLLAVLAFHPGDPAQFRFLEAPTAASLLAGLTLLRRLGALPAEGYRLTERGCRLAALPLHPRLGAVLEAARGKGLGQEGALLAALLGERDLLSEPALPASSHDSDLLHRRELFLALEAQGFAAAAARQLGVDRRAAREVQRACRQLSRLSGSPLRAATPQTRTETELAMPRALLGLVLAGYPDRVCRRRAAGSDQAVMVGGRGVRLAERSGVRQAELFVALEAEAGRPGLHSVSWVRQASAVDAELLAELFPEQLRCERAVRFDDRRGVVVGLERRLFADLMLLEREGVPVDDVQAARVLAEAAMARFPQRLRPGAEAQQTIARLRLAARCLPEADWPDASDFGLRALLPELCAGRRSLAELERLDWGAELLGRLDTSQRRLLEQQLPERLQVPSGSRLRVDYAAGLEAGGAAVLAVKLQELFGLRHTPRLCGGRLPLLLHLLAPNGRPVQVTQDLGSFWEHGYPEVRRSLRGRYPKHPWPEDPLSAAPTARSGRRR